MQVHAHGGQVYQTKDGMFYWIGEGQKPGCSGNLPPYGKGCDPQILEVSDGINLYSSADLQRWVFVGAIANNTSLQDPFCDGPVCRMERPKLLYNANTNKWMVHFHIAPPDLSTVPNRVGVLEADSITGPYVYVHSFRPNSRNSGDLTTFVDQPSGKAYLVRSQGSGPQDVIVASPLTDDGYDVGPPAWTAPRGEAPAVFQAGPTEYFIMFSDQTWWEPNQAKLARGESMEPDVRAAEFEVVTTPVDGPRSETTYDAQTTYVLQFTCQNGKQFFIWMGDRWNLRGPGGLANASYIWLPLLPRSDWSGSYKIVYHDTWSPSDYCRLSDDEHPPVPAPPLQR
eukprot:jgi/Botrbrau1/7845/Bobra.9_2s0022.2